jgi:osmotically-inducible protein OsmY
MSKRIVVAGFLTLLMLVGTFAVYVPARAAESAGEFVDDSVITTKVKSLLAEDNLLKSFEISVKTYKGVVELSGFVASDEVIKKAGEIASTVKGVASVKNDLNLK